MSWIECGSCEEMVDVCGGAVRLPFICGRCEKDAALAIDARDANDANDANEGLFIVECRSKQIRPHYSPEWFRSENDNTKGVFDDYSTALEAAEREQDGSPIMEYRVVPVKGCRVTDGCYPLESNFGAGECPRTAVPCQSAIDSVQADEYTIQDALDQFHADTELINGLTAETEDLKAQLSQANLNIQVQEEIIEDLETQLTDLRLDMCNVVFRTHF